MPSKTRAIVDEIFAELNAKIPYLKTVAMYDRKLPAIESKDGLPALILSIESVTPSAKKGDFEFEFLLDCLFDSDIKDAEALAMDFSLRVLKELKTIKLKSACTPPQALELNAAEFKGDESELLGSMIRWRQGFTVEAMSDEAGARLSSLSLEKGDLRGTDETERVTYDAENIAGATSPSV